MSEPLRGLRVWITRPRPAGKQSARTFAAAGASVWTEPLLELVPRAPEPAQVEAWRSLRDTYGLVFTSARAATAFVDWAGSPPPGTPVFAVGAATARTVTSLGLSVEEIPARATGVDLGRQLAVRGDLPPVLVFPASEARREETVAALRALPARLMELTLYRPEPRAPSAATREFLAAGPALIVLYSPSAAAALAAARVGSPCSALGPTTAAAARAHGLDLVATADPPDEAGLLRAVEAWWRSQ